MKLEGDPAISVRDTVFGVVHTYIGRNTIEADTIRPLGFDDGAPTPGGTDNLLLGSATDALKLGTGTDLLLLG